MLLTAAGIVRARHRSDEFLELLGCLDRQVPKQHLIQLILDPVRVHASAAMPRYLYWRPDRFAFHWLPLHASWLSFAEAWFAILTKKRPKREERADFADAERTITAFLDTYNTHRAQPFTWKTGVRFYQRLKDKLARHRRRHRLPHWPARAATAQAVGQLRRRVAGLV
ncbi:MAG: hypothetical protein QOF73_5440, partial [Thermomicrobiales bacterium]|nr:hypothetical protein [Thermomicrobiales bacterium]